MTEAELKSMVPNKTMVYARDGVGYTFMGITKDGLYQLCGLPYAYEKYMILNNFRLTRPP